MHRHVLEMMKSVSVTEANSGVLNLKTNRRPNNAHALSDPPTTEVHEVHPFREYMDNPAPDTSVSDSEEVMAYVNMKVGLAPPVSRGRRLGDVSSAPSPVMAFTSWSLRNSNCYITIV